MAIAPPALVPGAPRQPLPYGLFTTFAFTDSNARWENGVEWEYDCGRPTLVLSDDCDTAVVPKPVTADTGVGDASRFTVVHRYKCAPVGYTEAEHQDKATAGLVAREQGTVERALWSGSTSPSFAGASLNDVQADYDVAATPPISSWDPAVVLGAVKRQIIRDYGSLGVIHVGPIGASILERYNLIAPKGDRMFTVDGWPVAIGDYPEAPVDPENPFPIGADTVAIVATPALFGYRSEVFAHDPSFDQTVNEMHTIAERSYVIGWDPCVDPVYGLMGVPAETTPGVPAGCALRLTSPKDNQVMTDPVFPVSGKGAAPGAEVNLWVSDWLDTHATTTADEGGNWSFDGDSPASPGTQDWWVTSEGCRSNTVTLTIPEPEESFGWEVISWNESGIGWLGIRITSGTLPAGHYQQTGTGFDTVLNPTVVEPDIGPGDLYASTSLDDVGGTYRWAVTGPYGIYFQSTGAGTTASNATSLDTAVRVDSGTVTYTRT